jgi:hypothetical protein
MHADAVTGNSIWPLLLAEPRLPLVRFKLSASAESDGEARNVRLVRLDKSSAVVDSSPATAWVQRLKNGTMVHDQRWLDLPPEVRPEAWGIAVADGKDPPVQLKSVDAYAAEVCLTCVQPAQGELRLRVNAAPPLADPSAAPASAPGPAPQLPATGGAAAAQRSAAPGALQAQAVIDGEITALQPLAAATATGTAPSRSGRTAQPGRPAFRLPGWLPVVGFTVPGLLLLLLGTSLLRRPRVMD